MIKNIPNKVSGASGRAHGLTHVQMSDRHLDFINDVSP
jgi:hypothetical protein